jgi:hypothetical protein
MVLVYHYIGSFGLKLIWVSMWWWGKHVRGGKHVGGM